MAEQTKTASKVLRKFAKGEFLFRQNEETHELFIVKRGRVRIYKIEGRIEIDLDLVGPGAVIGEIAPIDKGTRTAFGVAVEETDAIVIAAEEFNSILSKIPEWFKKISLILVQRLREVDTKINRSLDGDRTNHVIALLSLLINSEHCTRNGATYEMNLKFVEDEIVDLLCLQPAEVTDILEKLAKDGLIQLTHSKITVLLKDSLDKMSDSFFQIAHETPTT